MEFTILKKWKDKETHNHTLRNNEVGLIQTERWAHRQKKKKVKVKSLSRVRLFATPWIVPGILQARILEWVAIPFSRGSSQPRDWTQVSRIVDRCFTVWATREVPGKKRKRDLLNRFWGRILQVSYRGLFIQQIYLWTLGRRIGGGCWAHTNCMIKISGDMYEAWEETCVGHLTRLETDEP